MGDTKQLTGMRGVYLVAAELSRLGFLAAPTSRSAIGADILATDQSCKRTYSVQVKTNAKTFSFWLDQRSMLLFLIRTSMFWSISVIIRVVKKLNTSLSQVLLLLKKRSTHSPKLAQNQSGISLTWLMLNHSE